MILQRNPSLPILQRSLSYHRFYSAKEFSPKTNGLPVVSLAPESGRGEVFAEFNLRQMFLAVRFFIDYLPPGKACVEASSRLSMSTHISLLP
jgi:hypothetical protein